MSAASMLARARDAIEEAVKEASALPASERRRKLNAGEGGLSKRVEVRLKNLGPGAPEFGFTLVEPFKSTAWEVSCE